MPEHQYKDVQSASDRKPHVGERQRKAEDVFNAPELGNAQGKLLPNKKGLGTHSQTFQIWLQCAFTCWDAAVSHKKKHKEAMSSGEVNALGVSRRDAPPGQHSGPVHLLLVLSHQLS